MCADTGILLHTHACGHATHIHAHELLFAHADTSHINCLEELMVSHCWAESMDECEEALHKFYKRNLSM